MIHKRISFGKWDAVELYELASGHFQEHCFSCESIKERLEKFLGEKEVKRIKNNLKKHPYCKKV